MKRALEYSYYNRDIDQELECYDLLGTFFFQNQKLTTANYYKKKAQSSDLEPQDSIVRKIANQGIKNYLLQRMIYNPEDEIMLYKVMPIFPDQIKNTLESSCLNTESKLFKNNVAAVLKTGSKRSVKTSDLDKQGIGFLKRVGDEVIKKKYYNRVFREQKFVNFDTKFEVQFKDIENPVKFKQYQSEQIRYLCGNNKDLKPSMETFTSEVDPENRDFGKERKKRE